MVRDHTVVNPPSITNCYKGATRLWRGAAGYGHKPAAGRHIDLRGTRRGTRWGPRENARGGPPFAEWPPSPPGRPPSQILCDFRVVWL